MRAIERKWGKEGWSRCLSSIKRVMSRAPHTVGCAGGSSSTDRRDSNTWLPFCTTSHIISPSPLLSCPLCSAVPPSVLLVFCDSLHLCFPFAPPFFSPPCFAFWSWLFFTFFLMSGYSKIFCSAFHMWYRGFRGNYFLTPQYPSTQCICAACQASARVARYGPWAQLLVLAQWGPKKH